VDIWGNELKGSSTDNAIIPFAQILKTYEKNPNNSFIYDAGITIGAGRGDKLSPISNRKELWRENKEKETFYQDYYTDEELFKYRKAAGEKFNKYVTKYREGRFWDGKQYKAVDVEKRKNKDKSLTGVRGIVQDIQNLWSDAKSEARDELFKDPQGLPDSPSSTVKERYKSDSPSSSIGY
jgi:hypothetical protein